MRLVPRQLQRSGMTGNVPYYGGRFTPAQAHAAAHGLGAPPPPAGSTLALTPSLMPMPAVNPTPVTIPGAVPGTPGPASSTALADIQRLVDAGVLTPDEATSLRARVRP